MPGSYERALTAVIPNAAMVNIYGRNGNLDGIDLGFGQMISCSKSDFSAVYSQCGQIDGVSATFTGTKTDVNNILTKLRVSIVSVQTFDNLTIICGVSPLIRGGVNVDGKRVNCQLAYCDGTVTVGFPLILGDY